MSRASVALWGCGRIGRATGELLGASSYEVKWLRDVNNAASAILSRDLGTGSILYTVPEPSGHPKVDVLIDASGDTSLLPYFASLLKAKRVSYVLLTRREPAADRQIMVGISQEGPRPGEITAVGSCTGNALVPFLHHLDKAFPVREASCRVLHPLKQDKIVYLRSINTALGSSLADFDPELAEVTSADSMELPVDRGMALDLAVSFQKELPKEQFYSWLREYEQRTPAFGFSQRQESSGTIIGNKKGCVLDSTVRLFGSHFRGLLWQDNETGFSARILDALSMTHLAN